MNNASTRCPNARCSWPRRSATASRMRCPIKAIKWVETGAALGALQAPAPASRRKLVRRNPAIAVAAAAGAGLLWYAARRKAKQARERRDRRQRHADRGQARQRRHRQAQTHAHGASGAERAAARDQRRVADAGDQTRSTGSRGMARVLCRRARCRRPRRRHRRGHRGSSITKRAPPPSRSSYQSWPPCVGDDLLGQRQAQAAGQAIGGIGFAQPHERLEQLVLLARRRCPGRDPRPAAASSPARRRGSTVRRRCRARTSSRC